MSGTCSSTLAASARPRPGRAAGVPVEELANRVAVGRGGGAIREPARDQLDVGAGSGQRRRQRVVVRHGEGRGVDDMYSHQRRRGASSSGRPASRAIRRAVARTSPPPTGWTRARPSRASRRTAGASADSGGSPGLRPMHIGDAAHRMAEEQRRQRHRPSRDAVVLAVVDLERADHVGIGRLGTRGGLDPRSVERPRELDQRIGADRKAVGHDDHVDGRPPAARRGGSKARTRRARPPTAARRSRDSGPARPGRR